jgi:hypothetical protein
MRRSRRIARRSRGSAAPAELARARLVYGEWLHREGRQRDAREQLRAADEMFTALGMNAFAGRARDELDAAGASVRSRELEEREVRIESREDLSRTLPPQQPPVRL